MKFHSLYLAKYPEIPVVQPEVCFFAYAQGKISTHQTREDALKVSKNVERCVMNQTEVNEYWRLVSARTQAATNEWYADLRAEYMNLSDLQFAIVYDVAYERGHSTGYDEVAGILGDIVNSYIAFAEAA